MKHIIYFLICLLGFNHSVQAILLSELSSEQIALKLEDKKIGVFVGTFDPLHIAHEELIAHVLDAGLVDYVIVGANDNMTHKPNASSWEIRSAFLEVVYESHPRVIITNNKQLGFPIVGSSVKYVRSFLRKYEILSIMGNDIATIPTLEEEIEKNFFENGGRVDTWLVDNNRPELNRSSRIPKLIGNKPVIEFISDTSNSSSAIRKKIKEGDFDNDESKELSPKVNDIIQRMKLYLPVQCSRIL